MWDVVPTFSSYDVGGCAPTRVRTMLRMCVFTGTGLEEAGKERMLFEEARSRLYRSEILQVNMRLKALVEIYTMQSFAQLCNLNFASFLPNLNFC